MSVDPGSRAASSSPLGGRRLRCAALPGCFEETVPFEPCLHTQPFCCTYPTHQRGSFNCCAVLCGLVCVCRDADLEDSMPSSWKDKSGEEKQVTSEAKL